MVQSSISIRIVRPSAQETSIASPLRAAKGLAAKPQRSVIIMIHLCSVEMDGLFWVQSAFFTAVPEKLHTKHVLFYETCNFYLSNSYVLQNVHSFVEFVQFYA